MNKIKILTCCGLLFLCVLLSVNDNAIIDPSRNIGDNDDETTRIIEPKYSWHLNILKKFGFISKEKQGGSRIYYA